MVFLTLQEAAARLRVSRSTLYRWSREGRLELCRLGSRATRVREVDLMRLEAEATPVHLSSPLTQADGDHEAWESVRTHDLARALRDVEREIPAEELSFYLRDLARTGIAVRWNAELEEFEETGR